MNKKERSKQTNKQITNKQTNITNKKERKKQTNE